jgi:HAD superfamily hydrolase (TIGR01509 family)
MEPSKYTSLAVDLGGVLLLYSTMNVTGFSPSQIKNALDSPGWHEYERGKTSQKECHDTVAETFGLTTESWKQAVMLMTERLQPNTELITAIKQLKTSYPKLTVYCLSNMPEPEFEHLKRDIDKWGIFDEFYASSTEKCRKPDIAFYKNFLERSNEGAGSCIFIDDHLENVVTAHSLGFRALLFEDTKSVITKLHNLLGDPVARGMAYLSQNAKTLFCETSTGEVQRDNYSQLLILQNTGNR